VQPRLLIKIEKLIINILIKYINKMSNTTYLVYTSWTTTMPNGGTVGGSLYLDYYPETEQDAIKIVEQFQKQSKITMKNTIYRYGYHLNNLYKN
jgi:hypothetical protein